VKRFAMTALCLVALAACDKPATTETKTDDPSKNTTTTTNATAAPTGAPTTASPVTVTINDSDVATPADFEETAEKAITAKNYKAELASLETEIGKD
jgi:hypothetical protein